MKEKIKKLFASIAAILLAIGMMGANVMPVMADGNPGSITIKNTQPDKTYSVYKVFDATYSGDNVSYTYTGNNASFISALEDEGSPFNYNSTTKTISLKDGKTSSDLVTFLDAQKNNLG